MSIHVQTYALNPDELRVMREYDYGVTAACLIGEEITLPIPGFHHSVFKEILALGRKTTALPIGHSRKAWTVPREHSKTTTIKLALTTLLRFQDFHFILYASNTQSMALNACRDMVTWLTSRSEEDLWGKSYISKKNESEGLWILKIPRPNRTLKTVVIRATGVMQQLRGLIIENKRPDILVFDDIEDLNTADSGAQQMKLDEWFFGTALKAAAKRSMQIVIGNLIRNTTLLARLLKMPSWNPTRYGCLVKDADGNLQPLWPHRHTVESLLQEYRDYRSLALGHVWESEMMNISRDETMAESIPESSLVPVLSPDSIDCGFICLDPAFGVENRNDRSALTVHARLKEYGVPVLLDSRSGRWTEDQIFDHILLMAQEWGLKTIAIESIAAQRLLIPLFRLLLKNRQLPDTLFTFLPLIGQNVKNAKAARITAFRNALRSKDYLLSDSQIILREQLQDWNPDDSSHDDEVDSAALGAVVWAHHGEIIKQFGEYTANIGELLYRLPQQTTNKTPFHLVAL